MKVIVDLCIIPMNAETSLSPYVAACQQILIDAGLSIRLHAFGTNVEGEWDTVMTAVKACHEKVHAMGAPRISTTIKLGTRIDKDQTMAQKVNHVESILNEGTVA